jgi:hypothetical protein
VTEEQLEAFMSDSDLIELMEAVKVSDDMLDVIKLSEVQHSEMLAWCLNPTEGHGQGDAVLKDFLIAAGRASAERCRYHTRVFFDHWTAARLRRTSFGSAFITREFHIALANSKLSKGITKRKGFLDLLVVDPVNKIVVAVENKAGAKLGSTQLDFYSQQVRERIGARPAFKDFWFAFVVLDRNLADYDEDKLRLLGNRWSLLDYSWLESAASRASQHVARNNQAAQLVMAYCQSLTGWEKESQARTFELAAGIALRHRAVVDKLRELRKSKIQDWTPRTLNDDGLCMFFHQNRALCTEVVQASGIPGLVRLLARAMGKEVVIERNGPTRASLATSRMRAFQKTGQDYWPMYIHVRRRDQGDDAHAPFRYDLRFIVRNASFVDASAGTRVRKELSVVVRGLATFPESAYRRVTLATQLTSEQCVEKCVEWAKKIDTRLLEVVAKG